MVGSNRVTHLSASAQAAGFRLEWVDEIGSTNDLCFERAREGAQSRLWIVAGIQDKGKGRLGRTWLSPPGNLFASLLLIDEFALARAPQLGLLAGVALIEAVRALVPPTLPLTLKWPNDLLCDDAKLAGILLEGSVLPDGRMACVIGFGVNCAHAPEGLAYPTASLASMGHTISTQDMFVSLTHSLSHALTQWADGDGFETMRTAWLRHAGAVGRKLRVVRGQEVFEGAYNGIDHNGHLLLATEQGEIVLSAGEVFLPHQVKESVKAQA